jgi:hypothetical protein
VPACWAHRPDGRREAHTKGPRGGQRVRGTRCPTKGGGNRPHHCRATGEQQVSAVSGAEHHTFCQLSNRQTCCDQKATPNLKITRPGPDNCAPRFSPYQPSNFAALEGSIHVRQQGYGDATICRCVSSCSACRLCPGQNRQITTEPCPAGRWPSSGQKAGACIREDWSRAERRCSGAGELLHRGLADGERREACSGRINCRSPDIVIRHAIARNKA